MSLIVTNVGLAAALDAKENGIKIKLKSIGFGSSGYTPSKAQTALNAEFLRRDFDKSSMFDGQLTVQVDFDVDEQFEAREIGYYLEDGTLFAVCSRGGVVISYKTTSSMLTESFDLILSDNLINTVVVDFKDVVPASETTLGVARIATIDETTAGTNDDAIVTPKKLKDVVDKKLDKSSKATDSDKLDGLHASDFSRSNHTHTAEQVGAYSKSESDGKYFLATKPRGGYQVEEVPWTVSSGVYLGHVSGASNLVVQFKGSNSCAAAQFRFSHNTGGIWYKTARDAHGFEQKFKRIYTEEYRPTFKDISAHSDSGQRCGESETLEDVIHQLSKDIAVIKLFMGIEQS